MDAFHYPEEEHEKHEAGDANILNSRSLSPMRSFSPWIPSMNYESNDDFQQPFDDPRYEPRPLPPSSATNSVPPISDLIQKALGTTAHAAAPAAPASSTQDAAHLSSSTSNGTTTANCRPAKRQKMKTAEAVAVSASTGNAFSSSCHFNHHQNFLWQEQFEQLLKFKGAFGHCNVPITFPQDQVLARWVKRQRYQYKREQEGKTSAINDARIRLLESIGFVWDAHAASWQEKFNSLANYRRLTGHCNIPSCDAEHAQLLTWMKCQRRQYKLFTSGGPSNITIDRINMLNSIGMQWTRSRRKGGKKEDDYDTTDES